MTTLGLLRSGYAEQEHLRRNRGKGSKRGGRKDTGRERIEGGMFEYFHKIEA
jgi:hypothetical protein